ncbi:MAG TPA: methyltransferase domain-containing protein [Ktedonobacteraceae bacterium]|nr:methyltransferase domain-containing protein [Ktedonobacteraceae bacterium]
MPSFSFDPIAHRYDATRGYPGDIAQQVTRRLDQFIGATPQTALLELGIGTGRIAFPLASLGRSYTGVDISEKMLAVLMEKLRQHSWQEDERPWGSLPDELPTVTPEVRRFIHHDPQGSMRLVISDITHLPFADASFDAVIAVHVLHLVDGWQQAVQEAVRVLRPGGLLLNCWDEYGKSDVQMISSRWRTIMDASGVNINRPGTTSHRQVVELLHTLGLEAQTECLLRWEQTATPRGAIERIVKREWSSTWMVPDDIFAASAEQLWQWANEYYGAGIDTERQVERRFIVSKTQV